MRQTRPSADALIAALLPRPTRRSMRKAEAGPLAAELQARGIAARSYQSDNLLLPKDRLDEVLVLLRQPPVLRTAEEMAALLARNPFPAEASASRVVVTFLADLHDPMGARTLASYRGPEPVRLIGREIWTLYGEEVARSPFTNLPLERLLGTVVAARTLHVVRALTYLLRRP